MGKALETVNKFFQALATDPQTADALVIDAFKFRGPTAEASNKHEYMQINMDFGPHVVGMDMLAQFENGDNVCSIYAMQIKTPAGEVITLKIADWVVVKDGRMVEEEIFYDPRQYIEAFGL